MTARRDRRQFIFGGTLLAASGLAVFARPPEERGPRSPDALARAIPEQIGPYRHRSSDDISLPERDETSLRIYQQYVARSYAADDLPPVTMLIAYGASQDYALQVHRPESCYPMSGYDIGPSRRVSLRLRAGGLINGVALTATRLGQEEQLLYWVRVAGEFPPTLWAQRALLLRLALERRRADGVLMRLSTPGGGAAALAALAAFNAMLLDNIGPYARRIILGADATASAPPPRSRS